MLAFLILLSCQEEKPKAAKKPVLSEQEIYQVFVGEDARALSRLEGQLESAKPSISPELLEKMLAFLNTDNFGAYPLPTLRSLVLGKMAVMAGEAGIKILEKCAAQDSDLSPHCRGRLQEIRRQSGG